MAEVKVFPAGELRHLAIAALQKAGVADDDARIIADVLVESELRGVATHGMVMLPLYIRRLQRGQVNPRPDIRVVKESPSHALFDGDNGPGHLVAVKAMSACVEKARKNQIGVVGVRNSNHFGMAAYYAMMALAENLIGFSATNTPPLIAPYGGTTPTFGNNPFAIAIPAGHDFPIVLDIAVSNVAFGKVFQAKQAGQKIPLSWALDKQGRPTDDPEVAYQAALLQSMGEHKGYGLSVVIDILTGVLTGALFARDIPPTGIGVGHFFTAFNPELFMSADEFGERLGRMTAQVKESSLADGAERVYLPGEKEHLCREERLKKGIPLPLHICEQLDNLGR